VRERDSSEREREPFCSLAFPALLQPLFHSSQMNSMPKRKKPPDPALAVKIISSMLCFPLCSNCPENYGSHLPCSAMGRSVLGRYSTIVRFPWLIKSLKPRSFPSSPASPAVCDDLARDGCRRQSALVIVAIARARGSRSALLKMFAQGWHLRSRASFTGAANLVKVEQFGLFAANNQSVGIETGLALCFLQVCGLSLYAIPLFFMLLWLMSAPMLLYSCVGSGLNYLCICLYPCKDCVNLDLDLYLALVVDWRGFGNGSYGVLHLNIKVDDSTYAYPVTCLFGYWICCWNILWTRSSTVLYSTSRFQLRQPHYLAGLFVVYDVELIAQSLSAISLEPLVHAWAQAPVSWTQQENLLSIRTQHV